MRPTQVLDVGYFIVSLMVVLSGVMLPPVVFGTIIIPLYISIAIWWYTLRRRLK